jgi:type I restriction enzyme S subunit
MRKAPTLVIFDDRLTQAILATAFRGELVPTEAELARREGRSYEPAGELLGRTGAGRATRYRLQGTDESSTDRQGSHANRKAAKPRGSA